MNNSIPLIRSLLLYLLIGFIANLTLLNPCLAQRNPFSLPDKINCQIQQQLPPPLLQWRLLGTIGQKDNWQSWLLDDNKQLLTLKEGDQLHDIPVTVATITASFTILSAYLTQTPHCHQSTVIKLTFQD